MIPFLFGITNSNFQKKQVFFQVELVLNVKVKIQFVKQKNKKTVHASIMLTIPSNKNKNVKNNIW